MIELIFATIFTISLRMLMEHLAIKFTALTDWLIYFKWLMICVVVITAAWILLRFVIEIVARVRRVRREE